MPPAGIDDVSPTNQGSLKSQKTEKQMGEPGCRPPEVNVLPAIAAVPRRLPYSVENGLSNVDSCDTDLMEADTDPASQLDS